MPVIGAKIDINKFIFQKVALKPEQQEKGSSLSKKGYALLAVGSDTEVFFRSKVTGKPMPCIGLIGGTKQNPREILEGKGFAVQEDNVMAEFNIPPASSAVSFSADVSRVLTYLKKVADHNDAELLINSSVHFDPKELEHPQAQHIGCEPDFCVWDRTINEFDQTKKELLKTLRSSGGHVHVSYSENGKKNKDLSMEGKEFLVMSMDVFLGLPSVWLDDDKERHLLYGKAGAFRPKDYGIEYRVLSNFWVKNDALRQFVFNQTKKAVEFVGDFRWRRFLLDRSSQIIEAINTRDKKKSQMLMAESGIALP